MATAGREPPEQRQAVAVATKRDEQAQRGSIEGLKLHIGERKAIV